MLKKVKTFIIAGIAALSLSACDVSYPVAVVGDNGMVFRGTATATFLEGGYFQATNGKSFCTGRYTPQPDLKSVNFPVRCNNGLTGIGTALFSDHRSGSGFITMSDGSRWQFIFGQGALAI